MSFFYFVLNIKKNHALHPIIFIYLEVALFSVCFRFLLEQLQLLLLLGRLLESLHIKELISRQVQKNLFQSMEAGPMTKVLP